MSQENINVRDTINNNGLKIFDPYTHITYPVFQDIHRVLREHGREITDVRERIIKLEMDRDKLVNDFNNKLVNQNSTNFLLWTSVVLLWLVKK